MMCFFVDLGDSKTMFGAPASGWTSDAVRKTKNKNTYNFVNFYANCKNDPSKTKISASPVDWSGSEMIKNTFLVADL